VSRDASFFRSRNGGAMSRNAIYERIRTWGRRARLSKKVSPHRLRHTFATHLMKKGELPAVIQELLGHRWITSTQIYLHTTAQDLRHAAEIHPVEILIEKVKDLLPNMKIPFQRSHFKEGGGCL
jgi:integrase/recombinase XerD